MGIKPLQMVALVFTGSIVYHRLVLYPNSAYSELLDCADKIRIYFYFTNFLLKY